MSPKAILAALVFLHSTTLRPYRVKTDATHVISSIIKTNENRSINQIHENKYVKISFSITITPPPLYLRTKTWHISKTVWNVPIKISPYPEIFVSLTTCLKFETSAYEQIAISVMSQFNDHVSLGLPDKMNMIHNVISF